MSDRYQPGDLVRVPKAGTHLSDVAWEVVEDRGEAGVRIGDRGEDGRLAVVIWADRADLEPITDGSTQP